MIDRAAGTPVRDDQEGAFAYSRIRSLKFEDADIPVVFPNPANDKLFVQDFTRVSSLRINDLNGNVVHQSGAMKNNEISVNKFTPGVHFVEIKWLDGRKTVRKIVLNP